MDRPGGYSSSTGYGGYSSSQGYQSPQTSYSGMQGTNEMRGADIIAEYLVKEKVPFILGYAGHGAIGLLDGIYKQTDRIRHISPRIEQAAGFMADVYYRLTRQPLAVYASTGPGPMNMMIAVANAFYDNSAFFLITGQVPTTQIDSGALQDDYRYNGDMSSIFQPVVKKSWRIRKVEDLCRASAGSLLADAHRPSRPGAFRHALQSLYRNRSGAASRTIDEALAQLALKRLRYSVERALDLL